VAVVATLSKGYDLDYIWKQVNRGPAKARPATASRPARAGGEPSGRWWGHGSKALGFEPGQRIEREAYDPLFGERQASDGTQLGRPPDGGRKPRTCAPSSWPPSRTPPPSASASSGLKPSGRPGLGVPRLDRTGQARHLAAAQAGNPAVPADSGTRAGLRRRPGSRGLTEAIH